MGNGTKQNAAFRRETLETAKHAQNQKRQWHKTKTKANQMYLLNSFSALKPKLKPYFLCNSNFNSNYYPITTTTTKSSITQMATKVDESNVGIFCFISNLPGFRGILKQRSYSSQKKQRHFQISFKFGLFLYSL